MHVVVIVGMAVCDAVRMPVLVFVCVWACACSWACGVGLTVMVVMILRVVVVRNAEHVLHQVLFSFHAFRPAVGGVFGGGLWVFMYGLDV